MFNGLNSLPAVVGLPHGCLVLRYVAHAVCPLAAVQSRYAMIFREHEHTTLPVCEDLGIGFLSAAYSKKSKFTDQQDFRRFIPQFSAEGMDKNQPLIDLVRSVADAKQVTPAQVALAWMLQKKPFIVPIPGTRKQKCLVENTASADVRLTADEMQALDCQLAALGY